MKILVSGGAGYIGSHTVVQLIAAGHDVVIVDNFSNAHPTVLGRLEALTGTRITLHSFDLTDHDNLGYWVETAARLGGGLAPQADHDPDAGIVRAPA